jgi:hypothetical protein
MDHINTVQSTVASRQFHLQMSHSPNLHAQLILTKISKITLVYEIQNIITLSRCEPGSLEQGKAFTKRQLHLLFTASMAGTRVDFTAFFTSPTTALYIPRLGLHFVCCYGEADGLCKCASDELLLKCQRVDQGEICLLL